MNCMGLDHVNLRTANLEAMVDFYRDALGLQPGPRPPFDFPGAWLYCQGQAVIHLVEVPHAPANQAPQLEHFALRGHDLPSFLERLQSLGIAYRIALLPEWNVRQVNIFDPDGNHLHIDFTPDNPLPGS